MRTSTMIVTLTTLHCRCGFALAITDHKDTEPERERESKRQVTDYDLDDEHGGGAGF